MSEELKPPAGLGPVEHTVRPGSEAPRWWKCDTHGPAKAGAWGCPECVREMRSEAADFHMAYRTKCDVETKAQAVEIERLRARLGEAADKALTYAASYEMAVARLVLAMDYMHPEQKQAFNAAWSAKRAELRGALGA